MGKSVHLIPVGFDFQRLVQPISQGTLEADEVYLLKSSRESSDEEAQKLAERMVERLEETFGTILGKKVERLSVGNIFKFEDAYPMAYEMIQDQVEQGNEVWVNISSMPRTVAFAFASAANSLIVEQPELRESVHTYYVSPEEYLVTQMIKELRTEREFLQNLDVKDSEVKERQQRISDLIDEIDQSGVTKGAKKMNGGLHVEFPTVPSADLHDFEKTVLHFLYEVGTVESTTELARELAAELDEKVDGDSFKSKVQYNVQKLQEKGFVDRTRVGNRTETALGTMGELWVETHPK
ncbi:HFX_2341 family transcriptional regulator domain-containing protein [Halomicrobium katesii]|uniref:HFX_2341 family transcriptional regulator domain-containing protein n=1 Tax=Halomicrobium katesii TaxID=437163 RepID=UPI00037EB91D|nr:DUF6293 family protein [Halomicrobium katesii]